MVEILSSSEPYFVTYDDATDLEPGPGYFFAVEFENEEVIKGPFSTFERAYDAREELIHYAKAENGGWDE